MSVKLEKLSSKNKTNTTDKSPKNKYNPSSGKAKKLNPIIDNLLKDPIVFKAAKTPDKVTIRPSSYQVFKSSKSNTGSDFSSVKEQKQTQQKEQREIEMARPKSLAEAMAKYAGMKYGKDPLKEQPEFKKRKATSEVDSKERLKKLLQTQTQTQTQTQAAMRKLIETPELTESSSASSATPEPKKESASADEEDEDEDEDDDDFHTAESNDEHDEDSQSDADADVDLDVDEEDDEDIDKLKSDSADSNDDNNEIEEEGEDDEDDEDEDDDDDDDDDDDQLKKDLKEDLLTKQVLKQSTETPPTSNNDDEDDEANSSISKPKLIDSNYSNSDFWDLNENPENHGSNGSSRITKSWGDFIENHQSLGLVNHGVTCYMNAAVQSMCHIPSLTKYLIDVNNGKHDDEIKPDSVTKVLASTVSKMFRLGHNKKIIYINPKKLCKRLEDINCMMSEWQQEDSHEYFMSLMSRLQEDSTPKGVKLNQSIIYDIFGGLLSQTVTCKNCGHISTTQQEFYDLSLGLDNRKKRTSLLVDPKQLLQLKEQIKNSKSSTEEDKIQLSKILQQRILLAQDLSKKDDKSDEEKADSRSNSNNIGTHHNNNTSNNQQHSQDDDSSAPSRKYSLESSIRDFFTPEIIKTDKRDQSGYVCEQCKVKTNAVKISTIQRSPETLSIHLKRFRFNGQQSQKVKANVSYPEVLDFTSYTTDMSTPTRYKLVSVIVHQGRSVSSGHYIAHSRQPDGSWATYDDEYVNKIPRASALSDPGAYVLFYERLTYKGVEGNGSISGEEARGNSGTKKRALAETGSANNKKSKTGRNRRRR